MTAPPSSRKILIRLPNWLGDAVMCSGAVYRFAESHPDCSITLMGNALSLSVFEHGPVSFETFVFDNRSGDRIFGLWQASQELRYREFDEAWLLTNSFSSALTLWLAGIRKRVGYAMHQRGLLLTDSRRMQAPKPHQAIQYSMLFDPSWTEEIQPRIYVTEREKDKARSLVPFTDKKRIALAPGAAYGTAKRWIMERYGELALRCVWENEQDVVVVGAPREIEIAEQVARAGRERVLNLAGKTTLRELYAVLSLCDAVVCNDSGIMHVASALGIPTVAIFGPTDWRETSPLGEQITLLREEMDCAPCKKRECPLGHHNCMKAIEVEAVFDAVTKWVDRQDSI